MKQLTRTQKDLIHMMENIQLFRETIICVMMLLETEEMHKQMISFLKENKKSGAAAEEPILLKAMSLNKSSEA